MEILDNYEEIFDNAIKEGILSDNEEDDIYAGMQEILCICIQRMRNTTSRIK